LESLEDRRLLSIDLLSGVTNPLMLGVAASGTSEAGSFAVSSDGRYVAFESAASNLVAGDSNSSRDVFVCDRQSGVVTMLSTDSAGVQGNADSIAPAISGDGRYVAFSSSAGNLVAGDSNAQDDIFLKDRLSGVTTRVSTSTAGVEGNNVSSEASLSSDGRYVVFTSLATNLVGSDTNACTDVFLKDLASGTTTRVSTDSAGTQGNGESNSAMISGEGRYVAFVSLASNLTGGDVNMAGDIFVKDLQTGGTTRVSTSSTGTVANDESVHPSISNGGRYVAFTSDATNLVTGDTNLVRDIFVKDRQTGATTRVSTTSAGAEAAAASGAASISSDGRYVTFRSDAANLVSGDTNAAADVFLRDLASNVTTRVSTTSAGAEADDESVHPAISSDGRYVVFSSNAANLAAGDINGLRDVFVKDVRAGTVSLLSGRNTSVAGPFAGNGGSTEPVLSGDGRYVVFTSSATNLVSDDSNHDSDVFVLDTLAGDRMRVSTDSQGGQGNNDSDSPAITSDGHYVVFCSAATDLVDGDANGFVDVFRKDMLTGIVALVSADGMGASTNGDSAGPVVSDDGRYVVFSSLASNLVVGDSNLCGDVFRKDMVSGAIVRVSTGTLGVQGGGLSDSPAISGDGRYVAFRSDATDLISTDTNKDSDVFLKDMQTGTLIRVSTTSSGAQADDDSSHPSLSDDGRYVAFTSDATNLVGSDTNSYQDVFVKDLQTGATMRVSTSSIGSQGNGDSAAPSLSGDGRYVAFRSDATNLVAGDSNAQDDVFVKDLLTNATIGISNPATGIEPNNDSYQPALSGDGLHVVFATDASNFLAGDGNEGGDVFLADNALTNQAPLALSLSNSSVAENLAVGTQVGLLVSDDPNANDTFTYTFATGAGDTDNDMFDIVDNVLYTDAVFDYEATAAYTVRIRTTDQGGLSYEQAFSISVVNVNESPAGIVVSGPLSVPELSATGTVACSLATTDPDAGGSFTYSLRDNAGGRFAIQGNQVVVADGSLLDYESSTSHTIRVRTTDQGGLWLDKDVVIAVTNVNESPTDIVVALPITVLEHSATGTVVCVMATSDPDAGDTFAYSLRDDAGGRFAIQGDQIVVADGSLLDYDTAKSHTIRVRTTDRDGLWYEESLTVYVTNVNHAPTDISATLPIAVAENSAAGTLVTTLTTTDPDLGDLHTYTLVDNAGGRFAIQGDQVVVANGALLDYEVDTSHTIRVRTTDRGGLWYEEQFTVQVTDVDDVIHATTIGLFDPASSTFYLRSENSSGSADYSFGYGEPGKGWIVLTGDWNGDGNMGVGLYAPESSTFYLTNEYVSGYAEYTFGYGEPGGGWIPLVGDWNGDGRAGVGLYNPKASTFYLTDSLKSGFAEYTFGYGEPGGGWTPLVGNWNGSGGDGVGLYNPHSSSFYLTDTLSSGYAEHTFAFGEAGGGWTPLVGDWNGDGAAGVGLFAPSASMFYLTNAFKSGYAQYTFGYGEPGGGWKPLVGDWNGDARSGVGLYDPAASTFYLTNHLTAGVAEYTVAFGQPGGNQQPIVGCWQEVTANASAAALNPTAVDQIDLAQLAAEELANSAAVRTLDAC
jgi:Tol biopolymer transport system component